MAMRSPKRPTLRTVGANPRLPRPAVQPVYENFRPMSEWQQDEESNVLLLVYLPGFPRQHLKVSTEGRNIVRVYGERLVAGNKWSQFEEDYPVPEDCNMSGIRAKFEGGILTITMPRKKESAKPSQQRKTQEELTSETRTTPDTERKPSPSKVTTPSISKEKGKFDEKTLESPPDKKMTRTEPQGGKKSEDEEQRETETTLFTIANDFKESLEAKLKPPKSQKPEKSKQESRDDRKGSEKVEKLADDQVEKVVELKSRKHKGDGDYVRKGKHIDPNEKQARADAASSSADHLGIGNYKKSAKSLMELNEERQLLVNVGVAVIVIVALGAYVSYTFGSAKAN